jgi:hypothetical protein
MNKRASARGTGKPRRGRAGPSGRPSADRARTVPAGSVSSVLQRRFLWFLAGLILLAVVASLIAFDPILSTNGDNALYIVLAMSWARGTGNSTICTPGEPANTMVPPGYPLLLAPLVTLFPDRWLPLKWLSTVLFILSVPAVLFMIRERRESLSMAFGVAVLAAINVNLLIYSSMIMTEIPFTFFSILGLTLAQRSLRSGAGPMTGREKVLFALAIFSLAAAYHIRSIGIVLPAALVIYLLVRKRYRLALTAGLAILLLSLPWAVRNATGGEGGGYLEQFVLRNAYNPEMGTITAADLFQRIMTNLKTYGVFVNAQTVFPSLSPLLSFRGFTGAYILLGLVITAIVLTGFIVQVRRSLTLLEIYTALFLGVCLLWPEMWSGVRFIVPIIPLLLYYFLAGLRALARLLEVRLVRRTGQLSAAVVLMLVLFSSARGVAGAAERFRSYPAQWENYFAVARWCRQNTDQQSIFVARKPSLFYLHARRQVLNYPYTSDTERMMSFLSEENVDYVIMDGFNWTGTTQRYLMPAVGAHRERFQPVHRLENPDTWVLRLLRPAPVGEGP